MSTENPNGEVITEIVTPAGHAAREEQQKYEKSSVDGIEITAKFREFLQQVLDGKLPSVGDVPEQDPQVALMAAELVVMHLPEWLNPAGRRLADPVAISVPQAPRVAQYLIERGWRFHPEHETVRWAPTPGETSGPYDQGLHIHPDSAGNWPEPDPEAFYDFDDIKVEPLEDGTFSASHPRGVAFQAQTKSEAYAGIVDRLRAKIEEAKQA